MPKKASAPSSKNARPNGRIHDPIAANWSNPRRASGPTAAPKLSSAEASAPKRTLAAAWGCLFGSRKPSPGTRGRSSPHCRHSDWARGTSQFAQSRPFRQCLSTGNAARYVDDVFPDSTSEAFAALWISRHKRNRLTGQLGSTVIRPSRLDRLNRSRVRRLAVMLSNESLAFKD